MHKVLTPPPSARPIPTVLLDIGLLRRRAKVPAHQPGTAGRSFSVGSLACLFFGCTFCPPARHLAQLRSAGDEAACQEVRDHWWYSSASIQTATRHQQIKQYLGC